MTHFTIFGKSRTKYNNVDYIHISLQKITYKLYNIERIKRFIDCGGVICEESVVNFQLWNVDGYEHRLKPGKLLNIIKLSEEKLGIQNNEIEVEYQSITIGKYDLELVRKVVVPKSKTTDYLAQDACGIPLEKLKKNLAELPANSVSANLEEAVAKSISIWKHSTKDRIGKTSIRTNLWKR